MKRAGRDRQARRPPAADGYGGRAKVQTAAIALSAALLAACSVGPDYLPPPAATPGHWLETAPDGAKAARLDEWWKTFNDPVLNHLIADALRSNLDLKQAASRIAEARANRDATFALGLPAVNAQSSVTRRRNNTNFSAQGGSGGVGVGGQIINIFQMGFDASWEIDVFGGARRALEAADAKLDAAEEDRRDVQVSLLGEVARNYIELRANQQLLAITDENLRSQEDTLHLMQIRWQAGLSSALEVAQTEALASETRAQGPVYQNATRLAIHALAVLLGQAPGQLAARLESPGGIPASLDAKLGELPSELLRRRPDIRRAERKLAAANADIGVATAELYPRINLSTFLGLQNGNIASFTPIGKSWSVASSLSMPLFNWGRIQANIRAKEALDQQSLLAYQSTVLKAFKEVEDALSSHAEERKRIAALERSVEAQRLALALASERYRNGLAAYLDVLTAERGLFQSQRELAGSQAKQSAQLVALYKALGGGWAVGETPRG